MTVYVVDRSNNNPPSDPELDEMKAAGIAGLILKATEGAGFVDPTFADRARAAHARGLVVGAYAFIHANVAGTAQADLFNRTVDSAGIPVPIRCADAETADGNVQATVDAFCPAAHINLLYSGAYFFAANLAHPIPGVELWIAAYGSVRPAAPWGVEAGWQFTDGSRWGDCSIFDDAVWAQLTGSQPQGGDVPRPSDWIRHLDIGDGHYYHLRADGAVAASPDAPFVDYTALASDGSMYAFGPGKNGGVFAYPGLPDGERKGDRYFVDFWLG